MNEDQQKKCIDKMAFDTQKQAQTAATVAYHQRGIRLKPYQCRDCGLWHNATDHDA